MTQAKAQACASAIIGAGFDCRVHSTDGVNYTVRAIAPSFAISSAQIASLVASQTVSGNAAEVEFS